MDKQTALVRFEPCELYALSKASLLGIIQPILTRNTPKRERARLFHTG